MKMKRQIVAYKPVDGGDVLIPAKIVEKRDEMVEIKVKAGFRFLVNESQISEAPQWIIDEWDKAE